MRNENFITEEFSLFDKSPLESVFVETFVYAPSSREEGGLGSLYIAAEISSNKTKKENAEFLSKLVGVIKNEFYKNTIVTPISALRFSLKRANKFLEEEKIWRAPVSNLKIKMVVSAIKESGIHFARIGDAEVILLRGNNLQKIWNAPSSAIRQNFSFENIVSGEVLASDKIIFAAGQIHKISEDILMRNLKEQNLSDYLNKNSFGIKSLGVIALYPKDPNGFKKEGFKKDLPPLIPRIKTESPVLAAKKFAVNKHTFSPKTSDKIKKIRNIALALILVAFAAASTVITIKTRQDSARNKKMAETLVNEIADLKDKTSAMIELKNEQEANALLKSAREKTARLEQLGYFKTTRFELASELEKMSKSLSKVEVVSNLRTAIDLKNNSEIPELKEISAGKNKIFLIGENSYYEYDLNRNLGAINKMENEIKIASILPKPESPEKKLIVSQDKISEGNSVLWTKPETGTSAEIIQAEIYNNSFYILKDDSLIYKLPFEMSSSAGMALSELSLWTNIKEPSNQGQISNFAVDGSIFALTDPFGENKISKAVVEMENGKRTNKIELSEGVSKIFTSQSHKNIYALSPGEGLIISMDKNLNIKKRFSHPELKEAKSFFVNSQERAIYFLKGKAVYSFEI